MTWDLKGYCFDQTGFYEEDKVATITDGDSMNAFLLDNVEKHYELRVVDKDDFTVFHAVDQVLLFPIPEQGNTNNKWDTILKKFRTIGTEH